MLISRALLEGKLEPTWDLYDTVMKCTLNGYCESMCALSNVDVLQAMRVDLFKRGFVPPLKRLILKWLFPNPAMIRLAAVLSLVAARLRVGEFVRRLPAPVRARLRFVSLVPRHVTPFRRARPTQVIGQTRLRVGYFAGCANRLFSGERAEAVIKVLEENGCSVVMLGKEWCCGLPNWYNGDLDTQLALGRTNVKQFADLDVDYIVSDAASCVSTLRRLTGALKQHGGAGEAERAEVTLSKVFELCTFLTEIIDIRPGSELPPVNVVLHNSCYLRYGLRRPEVLARLLSKFPQVKVSDIEYGDVCCGGPEFLMQQPEMSEKILDLKIGGIRQANVPIVLSTSGGCIMTMDYALRRGGVNAIVMHPVELLAASYGYHTSAARAAMLR